MAADAIVENQALLAKAESKGRHPQRDENDHRKGKPGTCHASEHWETIPRLASRSITPDFPQFQANWLTEGLKKVDRGNIFL